MSATSERKTVRLFFRAPRVDFVNFQSKVLYYNKKTLSLLVKMIGISYIAMLEENIIMLNYYCFLF